MRLQRKNGNRYLKECKFELKIYRLAGLPLVYCVRSHVARISTILFEAWLSDQTRSVGLSCRFRAISTTLDGVAGSVWCFVSIR